MAITLASDSSSDAQITDGIGRGDLSAAARLWVRHWPTALTAARRYVAREEVPGLAAEALIGSISLTATGRGPREDVAAFVTAMVRELGEDDDLGPTGDSEAFPDVFVSPGLTSAFADLPAEHQHALRAAPSADEFTASLTVLQTSYLTTHLGAVPTRDCRPAHIAMLAVAEGSAQHGFAGHHWLHLSTCAWCTEAFHEISFANVALPALIAPAAWVPAAAAAPAPAPTPTPVAGPDAGPDAGPLVEAPVLASAESPEDVPSIDGETITIAAVAAAEPEPVPAPDAASAFVLETALDDLEGDDEAPPARALLRSGRQRLIAAGIAAVLIGGVAFAVTRNDDATAPTAAGTSPTADVTSADPGPTAGAEVDGAGAPSETPSVAVLAPTEAPTEAAAGAASQAPTKPTTKPTKATPTSKPTKVATAPSSPSPTTSAPSSPTPTPTPTPSATPTKHCNGLQHLLGIC